ncbi:MAG: hypothetical protein K2F79_06155 [Muribaculaceae bacterium]|nr:hypothetical protein [Muribaculaceae bacterium]
MYPTVFTPEHISELGPDDIFVFGSCSDGRHTQGAALTAFLRFGAIRGQSEGIQGQSYAIPTDSGSLETISKHINRFLDLAYEWDQNTFYITRIGCGQAGYTDSQIAPLFRRALSLYNVRLPKSFVEILRKE